MPDPTHEPGWCHWHRGYADDVALIHIVERNSGPSGSLRACATCRAEHNLRPLLEQIEDER